MNLQVIMMIEEMIIVIVQVGKEVQEINIDKLVKKAEDVQEIAQKTIKVVHQINTIEVGLTRHNREILIDPEIKQLI